MFLFIFFPLIFRLSSIHSARRQRRAPAGVAGWRDGGNERERREKEARSKAGLRSLFSPGVASLTPTTVDRGSCVSLCAVNTPSDASQGLLAFHSDTMHDALLDSIGDQALFGG